MSYRGRVIRRGPVACYLEPQSIQDQRERFVRLAKLFRARFYYNVTTVTGSPGSLPATGLLGQFPYPDLITGTLASQCPPNEPIWLRIGIPVTVTANAALSIRAEHGDVHRCVVVVRREGPEMVMAKIQYLSPFADKGEVIDVYSNETVITTDDRKLIVASTTGDESNPVSTPQDRTTIALPEGDIEIYVVLFATQNDVIAALANNLTSYTGPIDVDDWSRGIFI